VSAFTPDLLQYFAKLICAKQYGAVTTEVWSPFPYYDDQQLNYLLFMDARLANDMVDLGHLRREVGNRLQYVSGLLQEAFLDLRSEKTEDERRDAFNWLVVALVEPTRWIGNREGLAEMVRLINDGLVHLGALLRFSKEKGAFEVMALSASEHLEALSESTMFDRAEEEWSAAAMTSGNRVFVVHGHDEKAKLQTEVLLGRLGLQPIVLHREDNKGQTIIEKLERCADVRAAIVLLTPDDVGREAGWWRRLKPRARHNVVFEWGFFAALRRECLICICQGGIEVPSDLNGIVHYTYIRSVDELEARIESELRAAGLPVSRT